MTKNSHSIRRFSLKNEDLLLENASNAPFTRQTLPDKLGGYSDIFKLEDELSYIETHYKPVKHLSVLSKIDLQEPRLVLTVGVEGQSCFLYNKKQEILFKESYTSITAFNSIIGERQYKADHQMVQLRFLVGKQWLEKYFGVKQIERFFQRSEVNVLSYRPTSLIGRTCAAQLLNAKLPKEVQPAFIHGQAISVVSAELAALFEDKKRLKVSDQEAMQRAYEILKCEFKTPPTVSELAKRVGVNESKLKKLFHDFFDDTVYNVLLKIRMELAYQLLERNCSHISVVADTVGYGHLSNFSTAFSRYFGFSPKDIRKK